MKLNRCLIQHGLVLFTLVVTITLAGAQTPSVEKVTRKGDKVYALSEGKLMELKDKVVFPDDITINTNGTFQVKQGKERQLKEGEVLSKDGNLTSSDGTIRPVLDHLAMRNGTVTMVKDGDPSVLTGPVSLP